MAISHMYVIYYSAGGSLCLYECDSNWFDLLQLCVTAVTFFLSDHKTNITSLCDEHMNPPARLL